jgi:hypothetical protein
MLRGGIPTSDRPTLLEEQVAKQTIPLPALSPVGRCRSPCVSEYRSSMPRWVRKNGRIPSGRTACLTTRWKLRMDSTPGMPPNAVVYLLLTRSRAPAPSILMALVGLHPVPDQSCHGQQSRRRDFLHLPNMTYLSVAFVVYVDISPRLAEKDWK